MSYFFARKSKTRREESRGKEVLWKEFKEQDLSREGSGQPIISGKNPCIDEQCYVYNFETQFRSQSSHMRWVPGRTYMVRASPLVKGLWAKFCPKVVYVAFLVYKLPSWI